MRYILIVCLFLAGCDNAFLDYLDNMGCSDKYPIYILIGNKGASALFPVPLECKNLKNEK